MNSVYGDKGGAIVTYLIKATDTSGRLELHRDTRAGAVKKASELVADGCWDIDVLDDDGRSILVGELPEQTAGILESQ
ncbi:MAG: hypothetical protein EOO68_22815 [Moraxellaceae bacterium]|nr:MAG: hypothetical protein EOO68_22815 [Moraxellaceae bacterium]